MFASKSAFVASFIYPNQTKKCSVRMKCGDGHWREVSPTSHVQLHDFYSNCSNPSCSGPIPCRMCKNFSTYSSQTSCGTADLRARPFGVWVGFLLLFLAHDAFALQMVIICLPPSILPQFFVFCSTSRHCGPRSHP